MSTARGGGVSIQRVGLIVAVLAGAAAVRLWGAGEVSLWQDEALCVFNAERPFAQTVAILKHENQPPLYHFTLHVWMRLFGRSPLALRSLSILAGLVLILLIFQIGRRLFDERTAWWALAIAALSAALVEFSQEVTPYALYLAVTIGASLLFIHVWQREGSWGPWAGYALLRAASIYIHYFALFVLCAEGFWVLLHWRARRGFLLRWIGSQLAVMAIFAPWLPTFVEQTRRVRESGFWVPPLRLLDPPNALRQWALWVPELDHRPWNAIILLAAGLYIVLLAKVFFEAVLGWFRRDLKATARTFDDGRSGATLAFCYLLIPMVVVAILSLRRSIFTPKYLLACAPFCYLLVARGIAGLRPRAAQYALGGAVLALSLVGCLFNVAHPGYRPPDVQKAAAEIRAQCQPGDLVVTHDSQNFSTLYYYLQDVQPTLVWWLSPNEQVPFWQGVEGFDKKMFVADLRPFLESRPRIWVASAIANLKRWESNYGDSLWDRVIQARYEGLSYRVASRHTYQGVELIRLEPAGP